jgi:hypothetical protein
MAALWNDVLARVGEERFNGLVQEIAERRLSPQTALQRMLQG